MKNLYGKSACIALALFLSASLSACNAAPDTASQPLEQKSESGPIDQPEALQPYVPEKTGEASSPKPPGQAAAEKTPEAGYVISPKTYDIKPVASASGSEQKLLLLTFDDAPRGESTYQILDILDKHQIKALFFINGIYAEKHLDALKAIVEHGHTIGNHTWDHTKLDTLPPDKQRDEILRVNAFLEKHLGQKPVFFRPPNGVNTNTVRQVMREEGMQSFNWSIGSNDWVTTDPEKIKSSVQQYLHSGGNILMHDKETTAAVLDEIIQQLIKADYQFVVPTHVYQEPTAS